MIDHTLSRRDLLKTGSVAALAALVQLANSDFAFPGESDEDELVPFLNMPRASDKMLDWETLDEWLTPSDQVFSVSHYNEPDISPAEYKLEIAGMVDCPRTLTLEELKALPQADRLMTLECSGNGVSKGFMSAVYNSRWTGTPLGALLTECGIQEGATEIVFFGVDKQTEKIRKEVEVEVPFGRSMSIADALDEKNILAHARNGEPIEPRNGAPVRLIVPGWYGIANVKWLRRIEVRNRRYMGRYMARDYVTIRGERQGGEVVFVESSVARMNLKSIVARVTRRASVDGNVPLKAFGAVWNDGTDIKSVEVRVDDGAWIPATLATEPRSQYSWTFFHADLGNVPPGAHTITSRATDATGRVQPTADDDEIALKKTYWEAYQQVVREIKVEA